MSAERILARNLFLVCSSHTRSFAETSKCTPKSAKENKRKSAKERKRAQKSTKERFRKKMQTTRFRNSQFRATKLLTKNALKISPKFLSLYSVGPKNPARSHQISRKITITDELLQECRKKLFAQKPFEAPNRPKPPQTPKFPEISGLPRNPPGIPTEFILSVIQSPTDIPLSSPEFSRNFSNFPEIAQIPLNPPNFRKNGGGEEFTQSARVQGEVIEPEKQ